MQLFETKGTESARTAKAARAVGLAVNANLWRTFDYLWPEALGCPQLGQRVRVPFGPTNRPALAFVVDCARDSRRPDLKTVAEVVDKEALFDARLWELGQWISRYYLTPLGVTLAAMIPSAVGRSSPQSETVVFLTSTPAGWPSGLGPRQKTVLGELFEARKQGVEPLRLESLLHHSGASPDSFRRLRQRNLIRLESRPVQPPDAAGVQADDPFELNADQQRVLAALEAKLDAGFSCTLLYGVTGSGKTEVYVRAIRKVMAAGRQAILLVPEIALATQTLQRLIRRLGRVAVMHSGLTDAQRASCYQQIRDGRTAVVVGPRSAVFAPTRKLGLIVVDEEHESSYKQDSAPRYHGRDVAIKRASLEDVPVLLGSATPSLESLHNVHDGRYGLLRLPSRVLGLPMPRLQVINLRKEVQHGRIELLGRTLTLKMATALDRQEQVILLMNRRGYASYVFCPRCDWQFSCDQCTRLMVYHQATQLAMCHYCRHCSPVPASCPACGGKLVYFGYGIQRIESELARKFPTAKVARMDSDTMTSSGQFRKVLDLFGAGELDILLGTQMVAKGLDFPRVSLVGVVSADTSLIIPDFRSSERTFQLIVQVAGRAGRGPSQAGIGEVVIQTLYGDAPAIRFAANHDYDRFAAYELPLRQQTNLPPFWRMIRFVVRHAKVQVAERGAAVLAESLRKALPAKGVAIFGPQPAGVKKIRNQFRFQIVLTFQKAGLVQDLLLPRMETLWRDCPAEVVTDVDPMNLM